MLEIRRAHPEDFGTCATLAEVVAADRGPRFVREALERRQLLVAHDDGRIMGFLAYRTDWFNCTFVTLVGITPEQQATGVAQALYRAIENESPSARLFSSTEETNAAGIRMHSGLGFTPSGYIDNLPQGYRELIFYKRLAGSLRKGGGRTFWGDDGEARHE